MREGYRAYKNFLKRAMQEKDEPKLPGLQKYSNDQLFFISFAQVSFWSFIIEICLILVPGFPYIKFLTLYI